MTAIPSIRIAHTSATDARSAVRDFHAEVAGLDMALVVFFCSSHYDLGALSDEMNLLFPDVPVIGCTTAGEIGPAGYRKQSLVGVGFPMQGFTVAVGRLDHLQQFRDETGKALVGTLKAGLDEQAPDTAPCNRNRFAMQLIDGLSNREEAVVHAFQHALRDTPMFGGSAGDDSKAEQTWVFCDGAFHTDSAVLAIIDTIYPFTIIKTHHFVGGQERLVVTEVDIPRRTVKELNGLPAAEEYARVLGVRPEQLDASSFAASPVVIRINGTDYVRSIRSANPDGSLTFYCAIDKGLVLRVAQGVDFIGNLQRTFDEIHASIGTPQLVIACDCTFRNIELANKGLIGEAEGVFADNHVVGFNTYGEQFMGIHINQTLTGIAIGAQVGGMND